MNMKKVALPIVLMLLLAVTTVSAQVGGVAFSVSATSHLPTGILPVSGGKYKLTFADPVLTSVFASVPLDTVFIPSGQFRVPLLNKVFYLYTTDSQVIVNAMQVSHPHLVDKWKLESGKELLTPNDYNFNGQTNSALDLLNMPSAWDVTTGDPNVLIGISDFQLNPTHPELAGKFVGGIQMFLPGFGATSGTPCPFVPCSPNINNK